MSSPHTVGNEAIAQPRIRSLDGLRAVSIAMVLFSHLSGTRRFISLEAGNFFALGELGVTVFFVISGFLITTLLLRELDATGSISLQAFYFRRTLRIMPAYYVFIAGVAVLAAAGFVTLNRGDVAHALTYTSNYHTGRAWAVGHTWSLAVEEQFYLLWPAVLLLAGRRRGLAAAAALIAITPIVRLALWHYVPAVSDGIGQRFETVADALAIGAILAGWGPRLLREVWYTRLLDSRAFVLVPLLVVAVTALHERPRLFFGPGMVLMNVGIALTVHWCLRHTRGSVGRLLNSPPLVYVGVLSYSLYLWQQVFLDRQQSWWPHAFPSNLAFTIAAALASYYLVERPALGLRQRIEGRRRPQAAADRRPIFVAPPVAPVPE